MAPAWSRALGSIPPIAPACSKMPRRRLPNLAMPDVRANTALENTPALHNMVVCTLCSCYPWPVLGLPPVWYKSAPYRSKAVKDPRGVLADFGFELPDGTDIRVWDSTAEIRYMVLPMRPAGT